MASAVREEWSQSWRRRGAEKWREQEEIGADRWTQHLLLVCIGWFHVFFYYLICWLSLPLGYTASSQNQAWLTGGNLKDLDSQRYVVIGFGAQSKKKILAIADGKTWTHFLLFSSSAEPWKLFRRKKIRQSFGRAFVLQFCIIHIGRSILFSWTERKKAAFL